MKNISVSDLCEGMVLSKDAVDIRGRVILSAGNFIKDKHKNIFKSWGISKVCVEGDNKEERGKKTTDQIDPQISKVVEKEIKELYKFTDKRHPAIKELFDLSMERKVEKLMENDQ